MLRRAPLGCFLVFFAGVGAGACGRAESDPLPDVRLGMSPRDVRDRFARGEGGAWQTTLGGSADDTALEWRSSTARIDRARFEFHLGMLVAIRAHVRDPLPGSGSASGPERVDATPKTVTLRRPSDAAPGGTDVTVLARDCPTHKDEAESLVARAGR